MAAQHRKTVFTTIAVDGETNALVEKIRKRYSLKKGEVVRLAFRYLDKAHINPADAPESVKSELSKINKRQDDIIRFIRSYEENELNPMIRTAASVAARFEKVANNLSGKVDAEIAASKDLVKQVLRKLDEQFGKQSEAISGHSRVIEKVARIGKENNAKLLKLISLYTELTACGVMDGKRKESLKAEINALIDEH